MVRVIVGTQWGDEGKGRVAEFFAQNADVIARYQGGANTGHTIVLKGEQLVFHLVPCGIIYPHTLCIIGNGVVIDPEVFINEIKELKSRGINPDDRLFLSDRAHIVMPYHKTEDDPDGVLGTTKKGVGPCYEDKYARRGIRVADLLYPEIFKEKLSHNLKLHSSFDFEQTYSQYLSYGEFLAPFVTDTAELINRLIDDGKEVILEGAQGLLLDIDHGTYPFVTSSNPHAGAACTGLGIGPTKIDEVIGVTKAYTSRVGEGPFPTRLPPDIEDKVREHGQEYGATTGRPRKCGWLDAATVRNAIKISGIKKIVITKLDVLDILPVIKICKEYKNKRVKQLSHLSLSELVPDLEPVYEELEGWNTPTSNVREYNNLPSAAQKYLERLSELLNAEIVAVCVGPQKEATIFL